MKKNFKKRLLTVGLSVLVLAGCLVGGVTAMAQDNGESEATDPVSVVDLFEPEFGVEYTANVETPEYMMTGRNNYTPYASITKKDVPAEYYTGLNVHTATSNVTVKYMFGDLIDIISDTGNIVVEDYKKNGIFESNTGAICVYSTSVYTKGYKTRITTNSGKVRALIKANHLVLTTTGEADVRLAFQDVNEFSTFSDSFEHTITISGKSRAKVYMPTLKEGTNERVKYKFKATGVITGSILGLTDVVTGSANVSSYNDYQYYPSTDSVDNSLLLSTFKFTGGHIDFEGYASWTFSPNGFFDL